jgi:benzodiazapine receptor
VTSAARSIARPIAAAAAAALGIGAFGALTTHLGPWYQALHKPDWQPPDGLFGPMWTLIFAFTGAAFVVYWQRPVRRNARLEVIAAFLLNGVLNVLWSLLFFSLKRPDWALIEVVPLWLSIVAMLVLVRRASASAALLLTPYLLWVTFAAFLNWKIVALNAPFGHG